jgi:hypothetical protein
MLPKFENNCQKMFSAFCCFREHVSYADNFVFWVRYQALKLMTMVCGRTQTQSGMSSAEYCGHVRRKCKKSTLSGIATIVGIPTILLLAYPMLLDP